MAIQALHSPLKTTIDAMSERATSIPSHAALFVALVVAPGVYSRNRLFSLFAQAGAKRAKRRAAVVRGVLQQLATDAGAPPTLVMTPTGDQVTLRYFLPDMHCTRTVQVSALELAVLKYMGARRGIACLPTSDDVTALVEAHLRTLLD